MRSKKIFIPLILILVIVSASLIISIMLNYNIKNDIVSLKDDIKEFDNLSKDTSDNKELLNSEHEKLKQELEDRIKEYDVWENMKEKIIK